MTGNKPCGGPAGASDQFVRRPIEPTDEMLDAGAEALVAAAADPRSPFGQREIAGAIYRAMIIAGDHRGRGKVYRYPQAMSDRIRALWLAGETYVAIAAKTGTRPGSVYHHVTGTLGLSAAASRPRTR